MKAFDHVLKRIQQFDSSFQPGKINPQQTATSRGLQFLKKVPVKLLVTVPAPARYKVDGTLAKRQPPPLQPGDTVYVRLNANGTLDLFPFEMAGSGYELIRDAQENIHFTFLEDAE